MIRSAIVILIAILSLTGCGVPEMFRIEDPSARVGSVSVTGSSEHGEQVTVYVKVRNPNAAPLPLLSAHYTLIVAGETVTFEDEVHRTLPSEGMQTVPLPVALASPGRTLAGRSFDLRGSITYKPPGQFRKLLTESRIPLPAISFAGSGQIQ